MKFIPYGNKTITDYGIWVIINQLKSEFLIQGSLMKQFKYEISMFKRCKYIIGVNSRSRGLTLQKN